MKKLLLTGIAALFLATGTAHAGSPWTEADGPDVIFIALTKFRCGPAREIEVVLWQPYNTVTQKQLDFQRVTSTNSNEPLAGRMTYKDNTFFYDGKPCERPES